MKDDRVEWNNIEYYKVGENRNEQDRTDQNKIEINQRNCFLLPQR